MTEGDLKALIETTIGIPVFDAADSIIYPGATLEIYSEAPGLYGEGRGTSEVRQVQIDLWYTSKSARDTATGLLKAALSSVTTTTAQVERRYDTTANKFRSTFHFEIV